MEVRQLEERVSEGQTPGPWKASPGHHGPPRIPDHASEAIVTADAVVAFGAVDGR